MNRGGLGIVMQFSDEILDRNVIPHLSKVSRCGAPSLKVTDNHFSKFFIGSSFGPRRFSKGLHALLVVFFRRTDFSCVAYRQGRNQLRKYVQLLPADNSPTRHARLALTYFESSVIHLAAALKCGNAILSASHQVIADDDRCRRLQRISNRIRHFDEDVIKTGRLRPSFGISPVWIDDFGLLTNEDKLTFEELQQLLIECDAECASFARMLFPQNAIDAGKN